jgi:lipopolysaccharide/colanic/teichoic acid biosynthesis glycosyltransferase
MIYPKAKRTFDIFISFMGLIVLSPLFAIIGSLIIMNDNGTVFFRQKRVGLNRRIFSLFKFRTMTIDRETEDGLFEPGDTSRVTSVGRFLRKAKLDELPQLINVLKGDMSMVGPRPEVEKWTTVYPEKWQKVLTLRPGITDRASIEFRDEEKLLSESSDPESTYLDVILPRKLDLYLQYVEYNSFAGDIRIIFLTLKSIVFR